MLRTELRLVPHHPRWAEFFGIERERLAKALGPLVLEIEHVGSTSVPDLLAKPVIDIGMTVTSVADFEPCVGPVSGLGYEYRGQHGEDPLRRYFILEDGERRMAQIHLWTRDAEAWREAIRFKELLRDDEQLRRAYEEEKLRVAQEVDWNKQAYSLGKGPFIQDVLKSR
jgi:GrpB-like predicted nucleotidyltransferase (UPF0157 family)